MIPGQPLEKTRLDVHLHSVLYSKSSQDIVASLDASKTWTAEDMVDVNPRLLHRLANHSSLGFPYHSEGTVPAKPIRTISPLGN